MSTTTSRYVRWLEFIGDLLQTPLTELPARDLAAELTDTFGATQNSYVTKDKSGRVSSDFWPIPSPGLLSDSLAWARDADRQAEHPLVHWFVRTGDIAAQSIGRIEAEGPAQAMLWSWLEVARPHGIEHQLSIPIYLDGGHYRTFVLSRPDEDFTDADIELARLLQPIMIGLDRQATALAACFESAQSAKSIASDMLSTRELAVLGLLPAGLTAGAIAHRLSISPRTVSKHLENVYRKLGTSDRVTTVMRAQELGFLPPAGRGRPHLGTSSSGAGAATQTVNGA